MNPLNRKQSVHRISGEQNMRDAKEQPLGVLVGKNVTSVEFVMDYIRIHFGYAYLTAITDPVIIKDTEIKRGDSNYYNMLVTFIGRSVVEASVVEKDAIRIKLDDGTSLVISLKPENYVTAEAAMFNDGPANLWIW